MNESGMELNSLNQSQIQFYDDARDNSFHMSKLNAQDTLRQMQATHERSRSGLGCAAAQPKVDTTLDDEQ